MFYPDQLCQGINGPRGPIMLNINGPSDLCPDHLCGDRSHKETKTSRKDSWVLRSRIVVIFPRHVSNQSGFKHNMLVLF